MSDLQIVASAPLDGTIGRIRLAQIDIVHAAGLLNHFAEACSESDDFDSADAWLRVQYVCRMIERHCLDEGGFDVVPYFWLPDADLREREDTDRVPYCLWRDQGHLLTCPGKTNEPAVVARKLAELHGEFGIEAVAYDRWRIDDLKRELGAIGCDVPVKPHGQGFKDMSPSIDAIERVLIDEKVRHGGHPILTMCASNAKASMDPSGNRKLDKQKSTGRIDGLVAMTMAIGCATANPDTRSVYESDARPDGLLVI